MPSERRPLETTPWPCPSNLVWRELSFPVCDFQILVIHLVQARGVFNVQFPDPPGSVINCNPLLCYSDPDKLNWGCARSTKFMNRVPGKQEKEKEKENLAG